jgi:hypothetical protein
MRRRQFLQRVLSSKVGVLSASTAGSGLFALQSPLSNLTEAVLFPFDDYGFPFTKGLLLTLVPGRKSAGDHGSGSDPQHPNKPVLSPGQPGDPDSPRAYYYGTVLHIADEYRMWYTSMDERGNRLVCYAVSTDGISWVKPKLRLAEYNGSKENNLLVVEKDKAIKAASCLVLFEPGDSRPERRFKMIREIAPTQICAAFSSDGLHWQESSNNPIIKGSGLEPGGLINYNGCYYLNGHGGPIPHPIKGASKRMMVTFASYDFEHWTRAAHVSFRRDNVPPRPPGDFEPHRGEQVHVGAALWNRGNVILGFYGQYHNETNDRRTSTCDLGMIVSNDAIHFKEPIPDFKILPSYEESDDAEPRLITGQGFENVGERTFYWYGIWVAANPRGPTGVRLATWPRDRFGYFSPAPKIEDPHCISTVLPKGSERRNIFLNADGLSEQSYFTVEIVSERFTPMRGYSGSDCVPITQSGFRQRAIWRGKNGLERFQEPIRLRVNWGGAKLDEARLFSLYAD